jgi:DNA-binding transcriptional ArsR family regulator
MKIIEKKYRGSIVFRILGYPIRYAIVKMLLEHGPLGLDDIVKHVGRAKNTVCEHLSKLKLANIVRYEKERGRTIYFIKYPEELTILLEACEKLVKRSTKGLETDY